MRNMSNMNRTCDLRNDDEQHKESEIIKKKKKCRYFETVILPDPDGTKKKKGTNGQINDVQIDRC